LGRAGVSLSAPPNYVLATPPRREPKARTVDSQNKRGTTGKKSAKEESPKNTGRSFGGKKLAAARANSDARAG